MSRADGTPDRRPVTPCAPTRALGWLISLVALALVTTRPAPAAQQAAPPGTVSSFGRLVDAPGVDLVRARCGTCHEADLIAQQRLSRAGWDREVAKMERWGADVPGSDRDRLLDYLARHYAARDARAEAGPRPDVEALLRSRCTQCHELDLVESQRLSDAGWTRELDKMIRWGATLSDDEKSALAGHLAARFGPRPAVR